METVPGMVMVVIAVLLAKLDFALDFAAAAPRTRRATVAA